MSPVRKGVALAAIALPAMALAGAAAGDEQALPAVVMMVDTGQRDAAAPVVEAIEAQLSDLDVEFRVERIPALPLSLREQIALAEGRGDAPGTACVFWFDLAEDGAVYVHLRGGAGTGDRLLVRRLEPGPEEDRGRVEGLAIIVRSSVAALLAGGRIGILVDDIPEASPPSPPGPVPPPAPAEDAVAAAGNGPDRLSLQLGYAFAARGETHPAQHGMWLGLGLRLTRGLRVEAGYAVLAPLSARGELASLRLRRHPARAGLGYLLGSGRARLGGGIHLVVEHARQEIDGLAPGMRAADDLDEVTLALSPQVWAEFPVWNQLGVFIKAGVDLPLVPLSYVATRGERTEVLISAWPVQPWVTAGLQFLLW